MNKIQVIKRIGLDNWNKFEDWMKGQTVGIKEDGSYDYYEWDVLKFIHLLNNNKLR